MGFVLAPPRSCKGVFSFVYIEIRGRFSFSWYNYFHRKNHTFQCDMKLCMMSRWGVLSDQTVYLEEWKVELIVFFSALKPTNSGFPRLMILNLMTAFFLSWLPNTTFLSFNFKPCFVPSFRLNSKVLSISICFYESLSSVNRCLLLSLTISSLVDSDVMESKRWYCYTVQY